MKRPTNNNQHRPVTPEKLLRIQAKLNSGQSVNSISKQEDVSESNIRYYIKTGKTICKSA